MKPNKKYYLLLFVLLMGFCWTIPTAFSEDKTMDHSSMSHGGHSDHSSKPAVSGGEYRKEQTDTMDHGLMDHGENDGSIFRTKGAHDDMGMSKPQDMSSKALLARGRNIFLHMCVFCHGEDGNGGGTATQYLYPWPRDFRKGIFKFRTTPTGTLPRDEDLYRTIVEGVPGTSMPAWKDALTPEDTWALINHIKNFSERFKKEKQGEKIVAKTHPDSSPELIEKGKNIFQDLKCNRCHGDSLTGDGE
jgi:mono/diheme cytochrome c family protein